MRLSASKIISSRVLHRLRAAADPFKPVRESMQVETAVNSASNYSESEAESKTETETDRTTVTIATRSSVDEDSDGNKKRKAKDASKSPPTTATAKAHGGTVIYYKRSLHYESLDSPRLSSIEASNSQVSLTGHQDGISPLQSPQFISPLINFY
ncbi:unnamed protein product [Euphydryas editha]|uniref:Uncharacterized protein n=1 Tax=Euphydryas editha TaxID=104508 RepID=A0AAU9TNC6_EUPED|nr:unnamed protein product [Euphydryas editha]